MIVGVDDVVTAFGISQVLQCKVRNYLIGIHVDAGTGAPLKLVDRKLVQAALGNQHLIAGPHDRSRDFRVDRPKITVR